jgi:hypothetical protein
VEELGATEHQSLIFKPLILLSDNHFKFTFNFIQMLRVFLLWMVSFMMEHLTNNYCDGACGKGRQYSACTNATITAGVAHVGVHVRWEGPARFTQHKLADSVMASLSSSRIALVTGANQGIGQEIVRQLSKKFDGVVLLAKNYLLYVA